MAHSSLTEMKMELLNAAERHRSRLDDEAKAFRSYLTFLLTFSTGVLSVFAMVFSGSAYFLIGEQLNSRVTDYVVDKELRERAEKAAELAAEKAAQEQAAEVVGTLLRGAEEILTEKALMAADERLKDLSEQDLLEYLLPPGSVVGFQLDRCPPGWKVYKPASGRFLRGIDPEGQIDPAGTRTPGSVQADDLQSHLHQVASQETTKHAHTDGGSIFTALRAIHPIASQTAATVASGGPETRPKNVAVLFCWRPVSP